MCNTTYHQQRIKCQTCPFKKTCEVLQCNRRNIEKRIPGCSWHPEKEDTAHSREYNMIYDKFIKSQEKQQAKWKLWDEQLAAQKALQESNRIKLEKQRAEEIKQLSAEHEKYMKMLEQRNEESSRKLQKTMDDLNRGRQLSKMQETYKENRNGIKPCDTYPNFLNCHLAKCSIWMRELYCDEFKKRVKQHIEATGWEPLKQKPLPYFPN